MILNHTEIKARNILRKALKKNYDTASYNLRVDEIVTVHGKLKKSHLIKPNSMVVVTSKEKIELPEDLIGHAYIRTRLSQSGIMANNIGLIDPNYSGYLSTVLTNFGKDDFEIKEDDVFLRITISKINKPDVSIPMKFGPFVNKGQYLDYIKAKTMEFLDTSFINIDKVTNRIEKRVSDEFESNRIAARERQIRYGTMIGTFVAAISFIFLGITYIYDNVKYEGLLREVDKVKDTHHVYDSYNNELLEEMMQVKQENVILRHRLDSIVNIDK